MLRYRYLASVLVYMMKGTLVGGGGVGMLLFIVYMLASMKKPAAACQAPPRQRVSPKETACRQMRDLMTPQNELFSPIVSSPKYCSK